MRISVVIPLYNHADMLPGCLRALLSQSRAVDEILIVDDASTDDGLQVAQTFSRQHAHVSVIRHDENRGCPAALNTGLHAVSGDLVLFAAADDMVLPDLILHAERLFELHPDAGLCCTEIALIDEANSVLGFRPPIVPIWQPGYVSAREVVRNLRTSDNWLCGPSIVYHRQRLIDIGGYDEALGSLCDGLAARLLAFKHGFLFIPDVLATWRISMTSLSHSTAMSTDLEQKNLDAASKWFKRHADDLPSWYEALFKRRYKFGILRLKLISEPIGRVRTVIRLVELFARYRPMALSLYVTNWIRKTRLSSTRVRTVETALRRLET